MKHLDRARRDVSGPSNIFRHFFGSLTASKELGGPIPCYLADPTPKSIGVRELADAPVGCEKDLLRKILYLAVREPEQKYPVDQRRVLFIKFTECLAVAGHDFKIFVGLEELSFPMMAIGACGLMNAVGNLRPRVLSDLCEAVWNGDLKTAQDLHHRLHDLNKAIFYDTNPIPIKYMAKRLGIVDRNEHRLPMVPATPELEKRLDGVRSRAGMLTKEAAE